MRRMLVQLAGQPVLQFVHVHRPDQASLGSQAARIFIR